MANEIVVIAEDPKIKNFAIGIAGLCHFPYVEERVISKTMVECLTRNPQALIIEVSDQDKVRSFLEASRELGTNRLAQRIHLMMPKDFTLQCSELLKNPAFGHLIMLKDEVSQKEAAQYSKIVMNLENNGVNGIRGLLGTKADVQVIDLVETVQKALLTELMLVYLVDLGWNERIAQTICAAFDELLMNAALDAPVVGTQKIGNRLTLSDVEIHVGTEGDYFGVSVIDHHGTLKLADVWKSASKAFTKAGTLTVNEELNRGAGIGLSLILKSGGCLCFWNVPNKRTEVSVIFKREKSMKNLKNHLQYIVTCQSI